MGSPLLNWSCFDKDGRSLGGMTRHLPEWLDWRAIEAKEFYVRHMGGLPLGTRYVLIESQGETRLCIGMEEAATGDTSSPEAVQLHRSKEDGAQARVTEACRERGIDLAGKPRNQ